MGRRADRILRGTESARVCFLTPGGPVYVSVVELGDAPNSERGAS